MRKLTLDDTDGSQYLAYIHRIKKSVAWLCAICGWKAWGEDHFDIVVHHKNKNSTDHRKENLVVLCCDCHDKLHGHLLSKRRQKIVRERAKLIPKQPTYKGQHRVYDEKGWPV